MRRFLFPSLLTLAGPNLPGCGPDRAAEDPITQAGLRRALTPPPRAVTDLPPGLPSRTRQLTAIRATVQQDDRVLASLRDLQVRTTDDRGGEHLSVSTLTEGEHVIESGQRCWLVDGAKYVGWRTRRPQKLRAVTTDGPCLGDHPLAELLRRFADKVQVSRTADGLEFTLRDRERPPPDSIPLSWPTRADGTPLPPSLAEPRDLYLVGHARPVRFDGRVRIADGRLLTGWLNARFALRKDGQTAALYLTIRVWQTPYAGRLRPPADFETERARPRVVPNIKAVLGSVPATPGSLPGPGDAPPLRLRGESP